MDANSESKHLDDSEYSYYAFISYTEKDEYWAKWLQWHLEHYRIPEKVRKERKDLPEKVKPVFWYKNDLAGAHLSGSIKRELAKSKYMIVVCSPASANSEWVNEEVRMFKEELGRGSKIIPFVVGGKIAAERPEEECLPALLRNLSHHEQLRCIDVREYGKNKSLVNIVSTLFDIRFGVLWNRFKHEQQRLLAVYSVVAILCSTLCFGIWDYFFHTKYEYFVDYADCNGMPTGIIQINNDKAKDHYRLYRFEYRKRTLQRVVYVDGDGNPQNHTNTEVVDRPCIQSLSYNNGELATIDCKDDTEKTMYIIHLPNKDKLAADLKDDDENQAANFIFSSTAVDQGNTLFQQSSFLDRVLKSPSKIARYIYERDDDGYIVRKMFGMHNGEDEIGMDANGISGFEYERDSLHRVVAIRFLDNHYEYTANNMGVAGKRYQYDADGNIAVAEYIDKNGNLKYNEHHWAKAVDTYDKNGYCIEERVYGADGNPCISAYGYHRIAVDYKNNCETISFFDLHDRPTYSLPLGDNPGGFSRIMNVRDSKGKLIEIRYMDSDGNLCYNNCHVAIHKIEYDDRGLIVGLRNYGADFKPCANTDGFFYEKRTYNTLGYLTGQSVYNIKEMPVQNNYGIHRLQVVYDNTGRRMAEVHAYNSEDWPVYCQLFNGAAWVKFKYHGSSRRVSEIFFYMHDNQPADTPNCGAKVSCERDPYGQIVEYRYYNTDYELSSNGYHCAIMKLEYNRMGMETDRRFYDEDDSPMCLDTGIFHIKSCYNRTGQLEQICCYDTLECLRNGSEGWAIHEFNYNNGAVCSNAVYGENNERIEVMGVHKYTYEIDDCGYTLSVSAYNKDLQPTLNSQVGAHKLANLYDDKRRVVGLDYYDDINRRPFARIRLKLNQRGMLTEQAAYNDSDELIESPFNCGVARIATEYDSQDRTLYICATDRNGRKMDTSFGYAEAFFSYNDNMQEGKFLDSNKKLVDNISLAEPCAYFMTYYNDTGQRIFYKAVKCSYGEDMATIRECYYCDNTQDMNVVKTIRCDNEFVSVCDASNGLTNTYLSFDDEYDEYCHIVDSIQQDVESKYGKSKLYP